MADRMPSGSTPVKQSAGSIRVQPTAQKVAPEEGAPDPALEQALARIETSFDRLREAHFWIHGIEQHYHYAEQFRWHLNAFLKALKEVPKLLSIELQNMPGFSSWFRDQQKSLAQDPLIAHLAKQRDIVVHRRMLLPDSECTVGITELRGIKLGIGFPSSPHEDSNHAMHLYLRVAATRGDFLGILSPDEDSVPCVRRIWRLTGFDADVVALCARAWLRTGETVADVVRWLGAEPPPLSLGCRHADQKVQFKLFNREKLTAEFRELGGRL